MIQEIYYAIISGFIIMAAYWYYRLKVTQKWLQSNQKIYFHENKTKIVTLIPVLDEAERIEETAKYFKNTFLHLNHEIIIITTEKEYEIFQKSTNAFLKKIKQAKTPEQLKENLPDRISTKLTKNNLRDLKKEAMIIVKKRPNTIEIVKKLSERLQITHIHYPYRTGRMAHQLNYAINKKRQKKVIYAIYNADSRPDRRTYDWVLSTQKQTGAKVFQQYGNYLKNAQEYKGWCIKSLTLLAAAIWQTRWSIGFEIYNSLKQYKIPSTNITYPINYCIGHGLFFTPEIFRTLAGFSESTYNEDAVFGLELSHLGIKITPIPYFDTCETPRTLKSLYIQKSTWYHGPLQAYTYAKKIMKRRPNTNKTKLYVMSTKLFSHALYWIFGPTMFVLALLINVLNPTIINIMLFVGIIVIFFAIPQTIAWKIGTKAININQKNVFLKQLIGAPIMYILHGLSAYRTIILTALKMIAEKEIIKQKTPAFT